MPAFNFATAELLKGFPVHFLPISAELTTPTGAAILSTIATPRQDLVMSRIKKVGLGAGSMNIKDHPNLLRVFLGESHDSLSDECTVIETNIDDMNPEIYGYLVEKLFAEGAQDATLSQIIMKKGRPGILLSVLANPNDVQRMSTLILQETTTLGLRIYPVDRLKIQRTTDTIETKYGPINVKVVEIEGKKRFTPEYDDCRNAALRQKIPIMKIYEEVQKKVHNRTPTSDAEE